MKVSGEIYLVYGSHGEYSDYSEWNVAAFTDEQKANLFKDLVQRKYNDAWARFKEDEESWWNLSEQGVKSPVPEVSVYLFEEDPAAPISSGYEATYSVTPVKFNPKF